MYKYLSFIIMIITIMIMLLLLLLLLSLSLLFTGVLPQLVQQIEHP